MSMDHDNDTRANRLETNHPFFDPYAVEGLERALRFANKFRNQKAFGAPGLLEQCKIWVRAYDDVERDDHLARFRKQVGLSCYDGFASIMADTLFGMSEKLHILRSSIGDEQLGTWSTLFLITRPQRGGIEALMEEYNAAQNLNAAELLDRITREKLRRNSLEKDE